MAEVDVNLLVELVKLMVDLAVMIKNVVISLIQWLVNFIFGVPVPAILITVIGIVVIIIWGVLSFNKITGSFRKGAFVLMLIAGIVIAVVFVSMIFGVLPTDPFVNETIPNLTVALNQTNITV